MIHYKGTMMIHYIVKHKDWGYLSQRAEDSVPACWTNIKKNAIKFASKSGALAAISGWSEGIRAEMNILEVGSHSESSDKGGLICPEMSFRIRAKKENEYVVYCMKSACALWNNAVYDRFEEGCGLKNPPRPV